MSKQSNFIAHVEDAEEDSGSSVEGIEGTRKYAISEAPVSPIKERPNTGKSRSEKRPSHRRSESSSASLSLTDSSDSTAHPAKKEREVRRPSQKDVSREQRLREKEKREQKLRAAEEEERRRAKAEAKAMKEIKAKKTRPTSSLKHAATQPVVQQSSIYKRGHVGHPEDPSCYGVAQPAASGSRPRAQTRPASYYAGQTSRPPIANAGWHQSHQPPPQPYPHHHVVGTFPPPLHMLPPSPASQMGLSPSPLTMPGYFDAAMTGHHANLKQRFETRPSSAMGFRSPAIRGYAPEEFESDAGSTRVSRRPSRSKKHEDDRKKMPPPPSIPKRPQSAFPQSTPFAPPPAPQAQRPSSRRGQSRPAAPHRRSVGFVDQPGYEDEDFQGDVGLFQDMSPGAPSPYEPRRTPSGRLRVQSNAYEQQALDIMPANGRGRAVAPYAGGGAPVGSFGTSYENDAYFSALRYQEDVSGPQVPLTADSLRKITKRGGVPSSRSTRSSGSRDDSEYKRSNTTGTGITRSSSGNNEDVIIKFSGTSVVRLQGAEIECSDGEIMFSRPGGGSDRASTIFQIEDARGRPERKALPLRARAPSQSDSQSRGYAPSYAPSYPPSHAPYDPALSPDNYF